MQHIVADGQMVGNGNKCCHPYRWLADGNMWLIRIPVIGFSESQAWRNKCSTFRGFVTKYILGKDVQDEEIDKLIIKSQNLEHFHGRSISNFSEFNVICLRDNVLISRFLLLS